MKKFAQHKSFIILFFTLIVGIIIEVGLLQNILGPNISRIIFIIIISIGFIVSFYFHNKEMETIKKRRFETVKEKEVKKEIFDSDTKTNENK